MKISRYWAQAFLMVILSGGFHTVSLKCAEPVKPPVQVASHEWHKSCDSMVSDLLDFLPGYMNDKKIPGCAISLICDHRIVWSEGFGYENSITRKPVGPATVFEVASNSKMITACVALLLVEQGKLALDTPLNSYLPKPWLPDSSYRDVITLRHVLSHRSGLGHNDMNRKILFPPGTKYYYSNLGFTYLQQVIEQISGRTLEQVASYMLFEPMGMANTSFTNKKSLRPRLANGHVPGSYLLTLAGTFFLISLVIVWIPGILIFRMTRKRWLPAKRTQIYGMCLTVILWLGITFAFFGIIGWLKYAWLTVIFGTVFLSLNLILFLSAKSILHCFPIRNIKITWALLLAWVVATVFALAVTTRSISNIPVPKWPTIRSMAPASLRTTAPDMARFLLAISDSCQTSLSVSAQMLQPQVNLHPEISWGLGTGIFHGPMGDALWQWGQNIDFQSLVLFWPENGTGIVVLTNSDWGQPDVAIEIAQSALGLNLGSIIRASHLEFTGE